MGIIRGRITHPIRGYNSTREIFNSELTNLSFTIIFERVRTGLVFMLHLNKILGFQHWARTRPTTQTFKIPLENESWVGTLLRQNLLSTYFNLNLVDDFKCSWRIVTWCSCCCPSHWADVQQVEVQACRGTVLKWHHQGVGNLQPTWSLS